MFVTLLWHEFLSLSPESIELGLSHWLLQIVHTRENVCWHFYNLFSVESVVKLYYKFKKNDWPCIVDLHRYNDQWKFVTQRLAFLATLMVYLRDDRLISREEVAGLLGGELLAKVFKNKEDTSVICVLSHSKISVFLFWKSYICYNEKAQSLHQFSCQLNYENCKPPYFMVMNELPNRHNLGFKIITCQ